MKHALHRVDHAGGGAVLEQAAQQCVGLLAGAFQSDDACAFVQ